MTNAHRSRLVPHHLIAAAFAVGLTVAAGAALAAQTPTAAEYLAIAGREQAARSATPPAPAPDLRRLAGAYEAFVRKHPLSGYSDNALLQGAGLLQLAFDRSNDAADQANAVRLLTWLEREYPTSSLVKTAKERLTALATPVSAPNASKPAGADPAGPPAPALITANAPASPLTAAATPAAASSATPPAQVKAITRSALPKGERITIELSREVSFSGDRVDNPDRVFFDFANATTPAAIADHLPNVSGTPIKTVRLGRPQPGTTRVVLEVTGKPRFSAFPLYDPFRLVIDIEADTSPASPAATATPAAFTASSVTTSQPSPAFARAPLPVAPASVSAGGAPAALSAPTPPASGAKDAAREAAAAPAAPESTSRGDFSLARQLGLGVSRIVIDAGHGGHDPGAQSNGITEAELTLDIALRLQKLLKDQPGLEPILTRSTDDFIPLQERTAIANREGADLFLSIHANASRQPTAHGVETYLLNFATNPQAEAVAARENASSGQTMGTLPEILKAIALNNKLAESRELATIVQTSMVRRLSTQNRSLRDLGVKQAPFVVLIGAQMPSVLAEISFVTNKPEAGLLKQGAYRQRIAQALCEAVLKYQASLKKVTTVATRDQGQ